jgi:hypothetical protein
VNEAPHEYAPADGVQRAVALARESLGTHSEWLTVRAATGELAAVRGWTVAELLADEGAGLDSIVARWRAAQPLSPPDPPAAIEAVAWALCLPPLLAVRERRMSICVELTMVRIELDDREHTTVWWPAHTTVEPVDTALDAYRRVVDDTVGLLGPLVEAIRERVAIGRRGLWGHVVNVFDAVGPRYTDVDPGPATAELALVERARAGTPLAQRTVLVDIDRSDGCRRTVRTSACCLAYRTSLPPDVRPRPWHSGPWARYCMACPLIPFDETVARANYWLDQET